MQPPIGINKQSKRQSQNPVQQLSDSLFFFLFSSVELLFFLSFLSLSQKQHFSAGKQASQHSFSVRQNEDNIKSAKRYVKNATIITLVKSFFPPFINDSARTLVMENQFKAVKIPANNVLILAIFGYYYDNYYFFNYIYLIFYNFKHLL